MAEEKRKQVLARLTPAGVSNLRQAAENYCGGNQSAAVELAVWHLQHPCDAWARGVLLADELAGRERALEAWARCVAWGASSVERTFKDYEWEFLSRALHAVSLDGMEVSPGQLLAERALSAAKENPSWTLLLVEAPDARMEARRLTAVVGKLRDLTSFEAWAVWLAVCHYWSTGGSDGHDDVSEWWTLKARTFRANQPVPAREPA